ncbi:MAG: SlyX family protein [Thiogranum sp.]|nr:SlyX family protein [Thiogranum sp.]
MTSNDFGERIETLEIRLSHQEATIDELTRTLLSQEQLLRHQGQAVERLQAQLRALASEPLSAPEDEAPPPHY